jgi:hypothetical protein
MGIISIEALQQAIRNFIWIWLINISTNSVCKKLKTWRQIEMLRLCQDNFHVETIYVRKYCAHKYVVKLHNYKFITPDSLSVKRKCLNEVTALSSFKNLLRFGFQ